MILILNLNPLVGAQMWNAELQELGAIVALREKRAIVKKAIRKVRSFSAFQSLECCSIPRQRDVDFLAQFD